MAWEYATFAPQNRKTCRLAIAGKCFSKKCRKCPHYVASEKVKKSEEDLTAETSPESTPNDPIDNIFIYCTDIRETYHFFISGDFDAPQVAEVYKADLVDNFNKIKRTQSRTPPWVWRHSKPVWVLYLYFERRLGIREIGRRVGLSHIRVLELVNLHRRVLENHLDEVVGAGVRRLYFHEKYFTRLTVTQIAEKYGVTHQAVSDPSGRLKGK